jgi:two-component system, NarL family, nitrate/nitrite response regulator NarL
MAIQLRVLVAGEIRLFREGLTLYLSGQPGLAVVAGAGSRRELIEQVAETHPDVLLLDMAMPESLQALREIAERVGGPRVVALAVPENEPAVLACAEAGITGYVTRDGSLDDLVMAVTRAARGETVLPPRFAGTLLRRFSALAAHVPEPAASAELTVRELEIARCVDEGMSNKMIAARLCIEVCTVKNHMHRILVKLNAQHRAEIPRRLRGAHAASDDAWASLRR